MCGSQSANALLNVVQLWDMPGYRVYSCGIPSCVRRSSNATVPGAVAYAWFVGTAGNESLQAITTLNSAAFAAPLAGSRQAAGAVTADYSRNSGIAFDGLLTTLFSAAGQGNA